MILRCLTIASLFVLGLNCLNINGKNYETTHILEGSVSKRTIYQKTSASEPSWIVKCSYNKTYLTTGWDTFYVETNSEMDDNFQAYIAGYVEGLETQPAIYDHYYNTIRPWCINDTETCEKINKYLDANMNWLKYMVDQHAATDIYWRQVGLFYQQMGGMVIGYNEVAPSEERLTHRDIWWMNFKWDIEDIKSAVMNETDRALKGNSHCSALIKLLHGNSDIFVAHNTWTGYQTMRRIAKRYTLPYEDIVGQSTSFSGYPGAIVSGDDFYIINSGLVVQETTNDNNNAALWANVKPEGVLEVVRVSIANRLAQGGRSWTKIFSQYNSGTYNNQWMVVDMKKFSPGSVKSELLWVAEQIPGYVRREDQTELLLRQGYWASYNIPFYPDIFTLVGNPELVRKYGDFFSYDKTPRALIFKRDQEKVVDLQSMMQLMRSNDFQHDPLSRCNCTPPYSSENTIASRNDLNPVNGSYPFKALGHRSSGATDAKVTSFSLSQSLAFLAVSGPTTGAHLPPFQWSKTDFNDKLSHRGHPDLWQFSPVLINWPQ